jgi:sucrose-6-phosphate hydrolase SacC (GH32 family)
MAMPLYRSDDLANWEYIGDFLQTDTGKSFNECPQIFHVGGKMAVAAFYPLRGRFDNYLVGRFENERFIPEASGVWDHGGHGHVRSFDAETVPDGRVIGWSTISVYAEHDALETARIGWKGMHSLPKEVELRPDNTLALQPAKEIEQLRGEVITSDPSKPDIALPANHQGQFELELTFSDTASIALTTRDGSITVGFDAETRIVATDTTKAPKAGSDTGHLFKTPALPIAKGEPVTVRLFYDRSVFEIYAAGHVTTVRHFPTDPSTVTATHTGAIKARAWPMKSIWTGMISAPLHGKP